jgi:hypothetical protein
VKPNVLDLSKAAIFGFEPGIVDLCGGTVVGYVSLSHPTLLMDRSFLLLFFKKEALFCFILSRRC